MSRTQALVLVLACLLAAAWAARRAGPSLYADDRSATTAAAAVEPLSSHAILVHADRLRTHLDSPPPFTPPVRNPFRFDTPRASPALVAQPRNKGVSAERTAHVERAGRPEMQLVGVAEDRAGNGGVQRTAIVSAMTQLFFAKEGERVLGRYEVTRIGADSVQLKDSDGQTFSLALR